MDATEFLTFCTRLICLHFSQLSETYLRNWSLCHNFEVSPSVARFDRKCNVIIAVLSRVFRKRKRILVTSMASSSPLRRKSNRRAAIVRGRLRPRLWRKPTEIGRRRWNSRNRWLLTFPRRRTIGLKRKTDVPKSLRFRRKWNVRGDVRRIFETAGPLSDSVVAGRRNYRMFYFTPGNNKTQYKIDAIRSLYPRGRRNASSRKREKKEQSCVCVVFLV